MTTMRTTRCSICPNDCPMPDSIEIDPLCESCKLELHLVGHYRAAGNPDVCLAGVRALRRGGLRCITCFGRGNGQCNDHR